MNTHKKPYTLLIDPPLMTALTRIKESEGVSVSEQIRRGIQLWLKSKGITPKRKHT